MDEPSRLFIKGTVSGRTAERRESRRNVVFTGIQKREVVKGGGEEKKGRGKGGKS